MDCPFTITEVFCGAGRVSDAFESGGHGAARFDVRINMAHNVHTPEGVMYLARCFAQTKPFESLGLLEPCCGSWVWVNLGSSLRSVCKVSFQEVGDIGWGWLGSLGINRWQVVSLLVFPRIRSPLQASYLRTSLAMLSGWTLYVGIQQLSVSAPFWFLCWCGFISLGPLNNQNFGTSITQINFFSRFIFCSPQLFNLWSFNLWSKQIVSAFVGRKNRITFRAFEWTIRFADLVLGSVGTGWDWCVPVQSIIFPVVVYEWQA